MPERSLERPADRCAFFVDGANWYNHLKDIGLRQSAIDIQKVAAKLAHSRQVVGIQYFIPEIDPSGALPYKANQQLISDLAKKPSVSITFGFIDRHMETNAFAKKLLAYLAGLRVRLPATVYSDLVDLAKENSEQLVYREKGVDVALACKMVEMAMNNDYDLAYLLSGDGDYCPAVRMVKNLKKRVFAASPAIGERLKQACDAAIRLKREWFLDCYL